MDVKVRWKIFENWQTNNNTMENLGKQRISLIALQIHKNIQEAVLILQFDGLHCIDQRKSFLPQLKTHKYFAENVDPAFTTLPVGFSHYPEIP